MIVTIINRNQIKSISLPQKIQGQYWLCEAVDGTEQRLTGVEGINGEWILKSNRNVKILDANQCPVKSTVLLPLSEYMLEKKDGERVLVFTEPITEDRQCFVKYLVKENTELTIGRAAQMDICYENKAVSFEHAVLSYKGGRWFLQDNGSTNGTFVNDIRIEKEELFFGDVIFIMGLKIIIGKNIIAVNHPDGQVSVTGKLPQCIRQTVKPAEEEYELGAQTYFYRSPRFKRDIETAVFKIDPPPASPITEELPWILVMGSSMAMGMMSAVTLTSAIINSNITSMIMGGSMLLGTVFLPMVTKSYEKNRKRKKEKLRQVKYRAYLSKISAQIEDACKLQKEILNENAITAAECEDRILETHRNLWERGFGQNDFLKVRLGRGEGVLNAEFKYSERKFSLNDDNLEEEQLALCEKEKPLHNIPITYSLYDNAISGVIGERNRVTEFAKGLIMQLAALYSYDEVKFVFLYDKEAHDFDFVRWLPHVWNDERSFRFVATDSNEVKEASAYFETIIESRKQLNESDLEDAAPYYIVFSMSKNLALRAEMLKKILASKVNLHMSVVAFCDERKDLPKECSMIVELEGAHGKIFDKNDISGKSVDFLPDINLTQDPLKLSVALANTVLDNGATHFKLPGMITFLELFGVGKVEHLNALARWKEHDPTKSLEAAVGVDTYGEPFMLDLHEKFHGPHGLVAGMTGSGKSEFIITYILSLAVNYHPNEVAFILIDYKGGGMAKSFENLPHTAGIITNLDGAAIKRSLISIESELKRRQAIFAAASKKIGVSNIDIYKYQKLYREGVVSEALQHLFIISDEFAELKTQQPEFMAQLVSAARIGRSLGIHLILATQKPSGVVDDQIWSNSRFRVCLKVQERADSMDMLKRPDAAELTDTGRFFLQVGYNELFELGQSAWSGAPYYPSDRVIQEKDNSVVVIDMNGHAVKRVKPDGKRLSDAKPKKQLDAITEYLKKIADEEHIKVRPLWLDPIPAVILLDKVREKYHAGAKRFELNPVIGEYDDPENQRQCVLRLPISSEGNVIVYGAAGSGKTSFLNAAVYSLLQEHTPEEVQLYLLDFASETLRAFSKAPHVGDVVLSHETEKISNLFKMLQSEMKTRKKLFADFGGDYGSYIRTSGKTLPQIVVVINNFSAFTEAYEEKEEAVAYLSREGTKYGIYFVLTALGAGAVRFRLLQNFKQLFVLQMNDESDYASILGKTEGLYPSKFKGRGLIKTEGIYEFQTASLTEGIPFDFIRNFCIESSKNWNGERAKKIPVLPDNVDTEFLSEYMDTQNRMNIPVGVEKNSLGVHKYPFGDSYITMAMSAGTECRRFASDLTELLNRAGLHSGIVFDIPNAVQQSRGSLKIVKSSGDCEDEVDRLFELVLYRNNTYKEAMEQGKQPEAFDQLFVVINSFQALYGSLSQQAQEKLNLILEKGAAQYGISVLIAEPARNVPSFSFEKWYKANVSSSDGIWIGRGITEQYHMKASKTTPEMHEEITPEFGYSLIRGRCIKLKLLNNKMEEYGVEQ